MPSTETEERAFRALETTETRRYRDVEYATIMTQLDMFKVEWRREVIAAGGNPGVHDANVLFTVWLLANYPDFAGLVKGRGIVITMGPSGA